MLDTPASIYLSHNGNKIVTRYSVTSNIRISYFATQFLPFIHYEQQKAYEKILVVVRMVTDVNVWNLFEYNNRNKNVFLLQVND